jgi:hypothetical protein
MYDVAKSYHLSVRDLKQLLELQEGKCAGCGYSSEYNIKGLCIDHDHKNLKVRGLLCQACNSAIGLLKDDPNICRRLAVYLEKHG